MNLYQLSTDKLSCADKNTYQKLEEKRSKKVNHLFLLNETIIK